MQFLARVLKGFVNVYQFFVCGAMLYGNKEGKRKVDVIKKHCKKLSTNVFFFSEVIFKLSDIVEIVSEGLAGA